MRVKNKNLAIFFDGLLKGGAESLILEMLPFFKSRFKNIDIFFINRGKPFSTDFEKHATLHPISFWNLLLVLSRKKDTIFYINLSKPIFIVNLLIFFFGNRKNRIYCHEHTSQAFFSQQNLFYKFLGYIYVCLIRINLKKKRMYYIVSSRADFSYFLALGTKKEHIIFFPNSIPSKKIDALSKIRRKIKERTSIREINCFTLCRLTPIKQIDWCIETMFNVAHAIPQIQFELNICGKGDDITRLKELANRRRFYKKNLEINFQGYVPSATPYLKRCDFYFLSSKFEGSPLSLTEAAFSRINCISTPSSPAILELRESFPNIHVCNEISLKSFSELTVSVISKYISNPELFNFKDPIHFKSLDKNTLKLLKDM